MNLDEALTQAEQATQRGDLEQAERVLQTSWPDFSNAPADALHALGMVRFQQGRLPEAEQLFRRAIAAEGASLRHHIALGHTLNAAGADAAATDAYAAAVRIDPDWPGLQLNYAHAAYRAGRSAIAEQAARYIIARTPNANAWDTLACALNAQGNAQEALKAAEEALKLKPEHTGAAHSKAAALLGLGKAKDALNAANALAERGVATPALWLTRAAALDKLGKRADADAAYAEAQMRWPQDERVRIAIARRS